MNRSIILSEQLNFLFLIFYIIENLILFSASNIKWPCQREVSIQGNAASFLNHNLLTVLAAFMYYSRKCWDNVCKLPTFSLNFKFLYETIFRRSLVSLTTGPLQRDYVPETRAGQAIVKFNQNEI